MSTAVDPEVAVTSSGSSGVVEASVVAMAGVGKATGPIFVPLVLYEDPVVLRLPRHQARDPRTPVAWAGRLLSSFCQVRPSSDTSILMMRWARPPSVGASHVQLQAGFARGYQGHILDLARGCQRLRLGLAGLSAS